jgi:hypothetical protein
MVLVVAVITALKIAALAEAGKMTTTTTTIEGSSSRGNGAPARPLAGLAKGDMR